MIGKGSAHGIQQGMWVRFDGEKHASFQISHGVEASQRTAFVNDTIDTVRGKIGKPIEIGVEVPPRA